MHYFHHACSSCEKCYDAVDLNYDGFWSNCPRDASPQLFSPQPSQVFLDIFPTASGTGVLRTPGILTFSNAFPGFPATSSSDDYWNMRNNAGIYGTTRRGDSYVTPPAPSGAEWCPAKHTPIRTQPVIPSPTPPAPTVASASATLSNSKSRGTQVRESLCCPVIDSRLGFPYPSQLVCVAIPFLPPRVPGVPVQSLTFSFQACCVYLLNRSCLALQVECLSTVTAGQILQQIADAPCEPGLGQDACLVFAVWIANADFELQLEPGESRCEFIHFSHFLRTPNE